MTHRWLTITPRCPRFRSSVPATRQSRDPRPCGAWSSSPKALFSLAAEWKTSGTSRRSKICHTATRWKCCRDQKNPHPCPLSHHRCFGKSSRTLTKLFVNSWLTKKSNSRDDEQVLKILVFIIVDDGTFLKFMRVKLYLLLELLSDFNHQTCF